MTLDYVEVPEDQVAPWRLELAAKVLRDVSRLLNVPPPEIVWVWISSWTTLGFMRPVDPSTIYIDARLTREELVKAISHEAVHIADAHGYGQTELSEWAASGIADIYVRRFLEGDDFAP